MANGVDVNIGADTRDFARAVKSGMIDPVEDAQGELDKYAEAGKSAGDQLEGTFRDQQRQTVELKDDIGRLNETIREKSRGAYQSAGESSKTFTRESSEGFDEIKDSARSNAIEVGASFTGGFDQAIGGLQGFVAEFLAGFGPAGIIAGVGAAALLGTISQAMTDGQEAADNQKQAVADLANEYLDAGHDGKISFDSVAQSIRAMATSTDGKDVIITLQKAFDAAKLAGTDYEGVVRAIASGSPAEIARVRAQVEQLASAHLKTTHEVDAYGNASRAAVGTNLDAVGANKALTRALDQAGKQATEAGRAERLAARAGLTDIALKADLLGQLQDGYDETAGSVDDYLDKEKKTLKVKDYIEAVEARRKELIRYKDELATSGLDAKAKKYIEGQGADAAAAMLAGYSKASPAQKAKLNEIWSTAGDQNADTYEAALGKNLAKIKPKAPPIPRPVVPAPDTSALERFFATRQPRIQIGVDLVDRTGKRIG